MGKKNAVTEEQLRQEVIADIEAIADFARQQAKENERLRDKLKRSEKEEGRLIRSLIWYEESYSRLSQSAKAEFRAAAEEVGKELQKEDPAQGGEP